MSETACATGKRMKNLDEALRCQRERIAETKKPHLVHQTVVAVEGDVPATFYYVSEFKECGRAATYKTYTPEEIGNSTILESARICAQQLATIEQKSYTVTCRKPAFYELFESAVWICEIREDKPSFLPRGCSLAGKGRRRQSP